VPITNATKNSDKDILTISGTAIHAITTKNGHTFLAEELQKSAETLRGKPLLKDHEATVDNIVGRLTDNISFDAKNNKVPFEAVVNDEKMKEMIGDGRITSVSVGAFVDDIEHEMNEDGEPTGNEILRGIEFSELSLVAVPADPNAGLASAVMESVKLKFDDPNVDKISLEVSDMTKEEIIEEKTSDEVVELQDKLDKIKADNLKLELELAEIAKEALTLKKEAEEEAEEEPAKEEESEEDAPAEKEEPESKEDDTKGDVAVDAPSEESALGDGFNFDRSDVSGYAISIDYNAMNKLKRYTKERFNPEVN